MILGVLPVRLFYRSGIHEVFQLQKDTGTPESNESFQEKLEIFEPNAPLPTWLETDLFKGGILDVMRSRFRRGQATLFVLREDEKLLGYAWIQNWRAFKSRYGSIVEDAIMLGPDWTHPDSRGLGIHPFIIQTRLDYLNRDLPIVAIVEEGNIDSSKGFLKNGFVSQGKVRVRTVLSVFHFSKVL